MKLLLIMAVLTSLGIFFVKRNSTKSNSAKRLKAPRVGFLTSVAILMLRLVRGVLGFVFVLAGFASFKFLRAMVVFVRNDGSQDNPFTIGASLVLVCIVLYSLFWLSSRIRTKVNQMHFERGSPDAPLIKSHWSL